MIEISEKVLMNIYASAKYAQGYICSMKEQLEGSISTANIDENTFSYIVSSLDLLQEQLENETGVLENTLKNRDEKE